MFMSLALAMSLTALLASLASGVLQATPDLPASVTAVLDREYPGWRIVPAPQYVPFASRLNLVQRDFDGDGVMDHALLIYYPGASGAGRQTRALVFLKGAKPVQLVDPRNGPDALDFELVLAEKGTRATDLDTNRPFTLERDGLTLVHREGGCRTFVYRKGRFESFWTCD